MLHPTLLLLAALAPQDQWSALPLPRICEQPFHGSQVPRPQAGQHLTLEDRPLNLSRKNGARLTAADLGSLLQQSARSAERELRISPYSPPLYAQGSSADLEWARATLHAIDSATAREELQVSAWLIPGGIGAPAPGDAALPEGTQSWSQTLHSGESVSFGERQRLDYVASYDVEVASHSGVAAPIIGQATTGKTLHLAVSRMDSGRRYHLRGHLDLSQVESLGTFDPQTPDLGKFTQPVVQSLGLSFSAVGDLGSYQSVEIEGGDGDLENWKLWIRVEGQPEPMGPTATGSAAGSDWRVIDVSLLEQRPPEFPALQPGAGLSNAGQLDAVTPASAPISASGVLAALQSSGRSSRGNVGRSADGGREALQICDGLILVAAPATAPGLAGLAKQFVSAAEAPKGVSTQVELRCGALRVQFPSAYGEVARLWVGTERSYVTGYHSEIAPNTWMPSPQVELALDGLAWQGRLGARSLNSEAFWSETTQVRTQNRDDVQLGSVQLPERRITSAQLAVKADGTQQAMWSAGATTPALSVRASLPK